MPEPLPSVRSLVVLFDGGCPICRRTVRFMRRFDWRGRLQFADAPGLTEREAMQQMYVVDSRGRRFAGYDAQLRIAREVPLLWPFALVGWVPGLRHIGLAVYRYIAANRQRRGVCSDELCSPAFRRR